MIRIILILIVILLAFWALRWFLRSSPEKIAGYIRRIFYVILVLVLLFFAAAGKLNWLFALLGVFAAVLARFLPVLIRFAPDLHKLWYFFVASKQGDSRRSGYYKSTDQMNVDEAYEILGLKVGASKQEIINAHRKLMQKIHPDRGGNDYLAAQINKAKEVLIKHYHPK